MMPSPRSMIPNPHSKWPSPLSKEQKFVRRFLLNVLDALEFSEKSGLTS